MATQQVVEPPLDQTVTLLTLVLRRNATVGRSIYCVDATPPHEDLVGPVIVLSSSLHKSKNLQFEPGFMTRVCDGG